MYDAQDKNNNPPPYFSENILTVLTKYIWNNVIYFTKLILFFHKFSFIVKTLLPTLLVMLYTGCLKLFAEASQIFMHSLLQLVFVRKTASSE